MNKKQPATIKVDKNFNDTISAYLLNKGSVKIIGLGIFKLKRMPEVKNGYNGFKKVYQNFPEYTKVIFTPTVKLKELIQQWK